MNNWTTKHEAAGTGNVQCRWRAPDGTWNARCRQLTLDERQVVDPWAIGHEVVGMIPENATAYIRIEPTTRAHLIFKMQHTGGMPNHRAGPMIKESILVSRGMIPFIHKTFQEVFAKLAGPDWTADQGQDGYDW